MSDEDEQEISSNVNSLRDKTNQRLSTIKSRLQELTREKTKYNVEKLTQNIEFLEGEIDHINHDIAEMNKEINAQIANKKILNAKKAILQSNLQLRSTNLEKALHDKERLEKELQKPKKSEVYRDLTRQKIKSIVEVLPQLEKQDEYDRQLEKAENVQTAARNKREHFLDELNAKSRKLSQLKQLLADSATVLPQIETEIEKLRLERRQISISLDEKNRHHRTTLLQRNSSILTVQSIEHDAFDDEKQKFNEQLEKIDILLKYFYKKMSEHNLSRNDIVYPTPSSELISPLFHPITPLPDETILSSSTDENVSSTKPQPTVAIAMKLPRNFISLEFNSTATSTITNEIIHSPHYDDKSFTYKKELPTDIIDKYSGIGNKKQQSTHGKKHKKHKKGFGMKHSSQIIVLYNEVRKTNDNNDVLPFVPMYEYELEPAIKALESLKQSLESYLNEISNRSVYNLSPSINEEDSEVLGDDDIRDSALDTFSETSSLIEVTNHSRDLISVSPQLISIPEARSSSSSDDKKTVVSSSSPSSSQHSHSKSEHQSTLFAPLTTVEESTPPLCPLTIQIAQIERQISDEGYRSIRNEKQQQRTTGTNSPSLTRSRSYDSTEKVDKWLSITTPPLPMSSIDKTINQTHNNDFRATDIDNKEEENHVESTIPVSNH